MDLDVRLYATLRRHVTARDGVLTVSVSSGATVLDLLAALGIDAAEVHLIIVNGIHAAPDHYLRDGDRVGLFPPIGGG